MHLNLGAMKSGKSSQAIAQLWRAELQNRKPMAFKHIRDTRDPGVICTYTKQGKVEYPCTMFDDPEEIWVKTEGAKVVVIDEIHLAPVGIVHVLLRLEIERQIETICCGLHSTWRGQQWATTNRLSGLPIITPHYHSAVCDICLGDAEWSQRIRDGRPVDWFETSEPTLKVGRDDYQPLCTGDWFKTTPGAWEALRQGLIGIVDPETTWDRAERR